MKERLLGSIPDLQSITWSFYLWRWVVFFHSQQRYSCFWLWVYCTERFNDPIEVVMNAKMSLALSMPKQHCHLKTIDTLTCQYKRAPIKKLLIDSTETSKRKWNHEWRFSMKSLKASKRANVNLEAFNWISSDRFCRSTWWKQWPLSFSSILGHLNHFIKGFLKSWWMLLRPSVNPMNAFKLVNSSLQI